MSLSSSCCISVASCSTGVEVECYAVYWSDHFLTLLRMASKSTFFHRSILWRTGLRLCALTLISVNTISWSLKPGAPSHLSVRDGLFERITSSVLSPRVGKFQASCVQHLEKRLVRGNRVLVRNNAVVGPVYIRQVNITTDPYGSTRG